MEFKEKLQILRTQMRISQEESWDFNCFHGEEVIYCKHEKVYFCLFHGGDLS